MTASITQPRVTCAAFLLALSPSAALAGNEDGIFVGNDAAMAGGAVTSTTNDGSALFYNPAGLAVVEGNTVDVSASAFIVRVYEIPGLLSTDAGDSADADFTEFVTVPSAISYARALSDRVKLGAGIFVPYSNNLILRSTLDVPAGEPPSSWVAALGVNHSRYHGALGAAFVVSPRLRVGVALHGIYDWATVSSLLSGGILDSSQDMPFAARRFAEEAVLVEGTTLGAQLRWGLQWQLLDHVRLGVSFQSPVYSVAVAVTASSAVGVATAEGDQFAGESVDDASFEFEQLKASRTNVGLSYTWGEHFVGLDGSYQSRLFNADISGSEEPVFNLRFGAKFRTTERLFVGAGLFTDLSDQPEPREYVDTKMDFVGGTAGIEFGNAYELAEKEEPESLRFSTTLAVRYAHGQGRVGGVRVEEPTELDQEIRFPAVKVNVHELSLHLGSGLYF